MSELTPRNSGPVAGRLITDDEREVIRAHLFDRAALQAQHEKTKMAVLFRVEQTVYEDALVENAATTVVERQDRITHPDLQGFMKRHRAEILMDMESDARALLRTSADAMEHIVAEPYTRYAPPTQRPLTLRELLFGRTDS